MLFSSLLFLTCALPLIWGSSLVLPKRWQNGWLLLISVLVYAWGGVGYTSILVSSILLNYWVGLRVNGALGKRWLQFGVLVNLGILAYFKYAMFVVRETNGLLRTLELPPFELPNIALPLGISFYTFQAISYQVDTYRQTTAPQRNPLHLGLYIAFFPQLIAGPIVRYQDMAQQIRQRARNWEKTAEGLERFLIGLAKKVLIANTLASGGDEIFALDFHTMDAFTAWVGALLYAGQIYYDFSGYSDMAIGLGLLFGFRLPENFNFPYASKSIREFWRRWHITLGAWFRDYLYIPLGGSRGSNWQTARNLLIVFVATGIWHGAAWAFLLWGLWHGLFIVLERQRWWPVEHVGYAFSVVLLGWVLFRTESMVLAGQYYVAMFGFNGTTVPFDWSFYWNAELTVISIIACGLAGAWTPQKRWLAKLASSVVATLPAGQFAADALRISSLLILFLLCLNALVNNNLNPFIYFRF
ncbi:MAG: MBOAT family protein [Bacteroidota bacterium]